jgi:hypothetical protein
LMIWPRRELDSGKFWVLVSLSSLTCSTSWSYTLKTQSPFTVLVAVTDFIFVWRETIRWWNAPWRYRKIFDFETSFLVSTASFEISFLTLEKNRKISRTQHRKMFQIQASKEKNRFRDLTR